MISNKSYNLYPNIENDKYFLYRHIRKDNNNVFYVGIGTKVLGSTIEKKYKRAFSLKSRNKIWQSITSNTEYDVEIVLTSSSKKVIFEKEKEFVNIYGKIIDKTGSLSNFTDGGDANFKVPKTVWEDRKKTMIKNGTYSKMVDKISKFSMNKGEVGRHTKKLYVYNTDGSFYKEFDTKKQLKKELNLGSTGIHKYKDKNTNFKDFIIYSFYKGEKLEDNSFYIVKDRRSIAAKLNNSKIKNRKCGNGRIRHRIKIINTKTNDFLVSENIRDLISFVNEQHSRKLAKKMYEYLKNGKIFNDIYLIEHA